MNEGLALKLFVSAFFYVEGLCFLGCAAISLSGLEGTLIPQNMMEYLTTQLHIPDGLNLH